jgi:hypothetical protein
MITAEKQNDFGFHAVTARISARHEAAEASRDLRRSPAGKTGSTQEPAVRCEAVNVRKHPAPTTRRLSRNKEKWTRRHQGGEKPVSCRWPAIRRTADAIVGLAADPGSSTASPTTTSARLPGGWLMAPAPMP